jgi:hypothetical protein
MMDVLPIVILALAISAFLWSRLLPKWWYGLALLLPYFAIHELGFLLLDAHMAINVSYAAMALLVLTPTFIYLVRNRFRHGSWVVLASVFFAAALFFRYADPQGYLPMGTHWLWHLFGAGTTWAVSEFLYRLELDAATAGGGLKPETPATESWSDSVQARQRLNASTATSEVLAS